MEKRWPLHPKPRSYETLEWYTRRLAECYGVRYESFCLRALSIPITDGEARRFREPTPELLRRLSDGTGIPVVQLEQMTFQRTLNRMLEELGRFAETPDGRAWLEKLSAKRFFENSTFCDNSSARA
jgi:hypothetical protein